MTDEVRILAYEPRHAQAWRELNTAWLKAGGFEIEAKDRAAIDDPRGTVLDAGGWIFMAERAGEAIGCCALLPMADGALEVAKMTVTPAARGFGLGMRLLEACEAAARQAGAERLYLETNASLAPALALYRRFGFVDLPPQPTPYARADGWMEKRL